MSEVEKELPEYRDALLELTNISNQQFSYLFETYVFIKQIKMIWSVLTKFFAFGCQ